MKGQFIGMNIKQKVTIKLQQVNINVSLNQIGIISNYYVIINNQAFDSDIKRYEEISKLTKGQGEGYATRCLLYYEYIKNHYHYRLIAIDLIRQNN